MKRAGMLTGGILVITIGILAIGYNVSSHKQTADADDFTPGHLIDNSVMRDTGTMSVSDIQSFIENEMSEVGGCQESHSESTKWQDFGQQYMCLENYKEDITENMPECTDQYIQEQFGFGSDDSRYSKAKTMCWWKGGRTNFNKSDSNAMNTDDTLGSNGRSAAYLIKKASNNHGINPQVLLVLLQKEQSLVKDVWPWIIQYQSATGFGCPDDADCDPKYRGFYNQVNEAAKMFKEILEEDDSRTNWYPPGDNDILYFPKEQNDSCGSSNVDVKNLATSALYNYTPYQPNQAALDNLYGTGDSCSTYGNRNFWRDFTDWFGSPTPSKDIVLMRNKDNDKIFVINKEKDLKIHVADGDALKAWGFDKLPKQEVSTDQLDNYDNGGTLHRLAFERGTGKAYFADDQKAYHIKNHNQAKAWNFKLGNAPWLKKNTVEYLHKKKLTYRVNSPVSPKLYMMDSNADTGRKVIQHYPSPTVLSAWEVNGRSTPVSEAYFCTSYDADGNCIPRWDTRKLGYPKATAGSTTKTFFINNGNKHELSAAMKPVYPGSTITLGQPSLNRFFDAPKANALLKETYDTKIYLLDKENYRHIGSPRHYNHWKPSGNGKTTKVSGAFLNMLTKSSSVDSFTATDGSDNYYMKQDKYKVESSLENAFTAPKAPVSVSSAVLDLYSTQNGIGTPYVTSPQTTKIFFLDGSGTKHHVSSIKKLKLLRAGTRHGTFGLPHSMIKGMDGGPATSYQFTSGGDDYVFDDGAYHQVLSGEWELSPKLTVANASLSDWFQSKADLNADFTLGDKYGSARNGTLYTTDNLRLGKVWSADDNSPTISSRLASFFDEGNLNVLVGSENPDNNRLYLYDRGKLYHIPSIAALRNLGLGRFGGKVKMTDAEINGLKDKKATYLLSKDAGVVDGGQRRRFRDTGAADAWFGSQTQSYTQKLIDLFAQITNSTKVGRLVTSSETSKYYCMYNGEKRWVTSFSSLEGSECSDEPLRGIDHNLLRQIPTGANI